MARETPPSPPPPPLLPPFPPSPSSRAPMIVHNHNSTDTEEKLTLIDFCYRLSACNTVSNEETVNGIAQDEQHTRQEAQLLMSLLASPLRLDKNTHSSESMSGDETSLLEPVSASESERSYASSSSSSSSSNSSASDSSSTYHSRCRGGTVASPESFSFTCPSLSLDNNSSSTSKRSTSSTASHSSSTSSPRCTSPATLLGRPLKVDDRDAVRLSADAMARNISQSFQKAVGWRIQAWIATLSAVLVKERENLASMGMRQESEVADRLLTTPEARLILQLSNAGESIKVTTTETSFQVGSSLVTSTTTALNGTVTSSIKTHQKEEKETGEPQPALKKQRLDGFDYQNRSLQVPPPTSLPLDLEEEGDYMYKVSHELVMKCLLGLSTPAGFSEVTMQVPGVIEGTFLSTETGMGEELRSVCMELDTGILAAMVEKSCRMVVRTSVEALAASSKEQPPTPPPEKFTTPTNSSSTFDITSPSPCYPPPVASEADVRSALVTPRAHFSDFSSPSPPPHPFNNEAMMPSPKPMLFPIPDDFDSSSGPRRISPQPQLLHHNQHPLAPRTSKSSLSASTSTCESSESFSMMPPLHHPTLVSPPPANDASIRYNDNNKNKKAPSLPILVEVACRVLHK